LKNDAAFLNVHHDDVPELVGKLCVVLGVPIPATEPVAKKAKTSDPVALELEKGVHAFCRAWQAAVWDRFRREQDLSRPARVLKFVEDSSHVYTPIRVDAWDSLSRIVTSSDDVRLMLNVPCLTKEGQARLTALDESHLVATFELKGLNLCVVNINTGAILMYPARWNTADPVHHLPLEPDAQWALVLRGVYDDGALHLSMHCVPQSFVLDFCTHVTGTCEGAWFRSGEPPSPAPVSNGSGGPAVTPADGAEPAPPLDPTPRATPAPVYVSSEKTDDMLGSTDFHAGAIRLLSHDCASQQQAMSALVAKRYRDYTATRKADIGTKTRSPGVLRLKDDARLPTPFCLLVRPPHPPPPPLPPSPTPCHACVLLSLYALSFLGSCSCIWRA
jgi:hypothetical protein